MELLCKASTVVFESLSCHKPLKGIYLNLLHIVTKSTSLKVRQRRSPRGHSPQNLNTLCFSPFLGTSGGHFAACLAAAFQQLGFEDEGLG